MPSLRPAAPAQPDARRLRALSVVAVLVAGCSDKGTLNVRHEPPAVTITSPSEGTSVYQGQAIRFEALAQTFDETDLTELTHKWVTGTESMCASAPVDSDGVASCDWGFSDVGEATVTVTVTDPQLDSAAATVTVRVLENNPPDIELIAPATGDFFEPGDLITFEALVSDPEDGPEDLTVSVTSNIDGDLGIDAAPSSSGAWIAAGSLSNGDHLITVRVTDTAGRSDQDTATISVNARPGAPSVVISPDPAESGLPLVVTVTTPAVDPEGDGLTYRYDWYLNGSLYQSGSNDTVSSGVTVRGHYWEVYAYGNDGFGYGDPGYDSITIQNSAPSIDGVNIDPLPPTTVDTLTAVPEGWDDQDGDTPRYRYAWYLNDTLDTSATTVTFSSSKTEKGDVVRVEVTPYDAEVSGDAVSSSDVIIENSPPTQPVVTITPSDPEPDDSLRCGITTASTDADGDAITYLYEWYQNGTLTSITSNTVEATYTAHGDSWECVVTPYDGEDEGSDNSDYVTINDGTAPVAPTINGIDDYRNDLDIALTGTCEASCDLDFYCSDDTTSWTESATCSSTGSFSITTEGTRGDVNECYATCTDAAGNTSANSNTVDTMICDPYDEFEDDAGYGDAGSAAISEWSSLSDDGDSINIEGNILDDDDGDWYSISASDDVADDYADGVDYFNFEVNLVAGTSTYEFFVYQDGYDTADRECSTAANEYSWFNQDKGDGSHAIPSETRSCGSGHALYNNCADDSADFYIKVQRKSSVSMSCQHYELEITNGVW